MSTFDFTEDIEIWRRFKAGAPAQSIATSEDMGVSTVLRIVLSVEREMGSSDRFHEMKFDAEGCPEPISKTNVKIPADNEKLENWRKRRKCCIDTTKIN